MIKLMELILEQTRELERFIEKPTVEDWAEKQLLKIIALRKIDKVIYEKNDR